MATWKGNVTARAQFASAPSPEFTEVQLAGQYWAVLHHAANTYSSHLALFHGCAFPALWGQLSPAPKALLCT